MGMAGKDVAVNIKGGVTCNSSSHIYKACSLVICSFKICHNTEPPPEAPELEDVRFSLRGTTYQNNSLVTLEDIGEGDDALLCETDQLACCRPPYTGAMGGVRGNWYFPNGTIVPIETVNSTTNDQWDFYSTRGDSVLSLHRKRNGEDGVYRCVIPDASNVTQTLYVGVYTTNIGEWCMVTFSTAHAAGN